MAAVPVFGQRVGVTAAAVQVLSHGPDVAGRDGRYALKLVATRPGVGARHHLPAGAIPVLNQRLVDIAALAAIVSHGPDVGGRDGRYAEKPVGTRPGGVGARHDLPAGAVPVLNQRPTDIAAIATRDSHGPNGRGRDDR